MTDDWIEYRRLILNELEQLRDCTTKLADDVERLNTKLTVLEVKAGLWGGGVSALLFLAAKLLEGKL